MKKTRDHEVVPGNTADVSRREFMKKTAAAAVVAAAGGTTLSKYARAATGRPLKIGFVTPKTGALADFAQANDFVIAGVHRVWANGLEINGVVHPVEILERDSRSDPNRAAELAAALIKSNKVDVLTANGTLEVVNPVADQAEINGVPCVTSDAPWQPYFFGRGGKPDKGFDWTFHFFWGTEDIIPLFINMWIEAPTNKVVGALWSNDTGGNAYGDAKVGFPPAILAKGFKLVDPGRFNPMTNDFSAEISLFKQNNVEILTGTLPTPAFSTFWIQAAQQGFRPKVASIGRALLFPAAVESLGDRGAGLTMEVWWTPRHPYKSSLTGQTAAQWCDEYERVSKRQWTQPLGFKHALFEVIGDTFKRTNNVDKPEALRDAILATNLDTIVGKIQWTGRPVKNVAKTLLCGGQWVKGKKFKYDLIVVNNDNAKFIPKQPLKLISY